MSVPVLATVAAVVVVGCGESQPPAAVGSIPELTVRVGSTESVGLAGYFSDPDGDELSYSASSSNAEVATVAISGDSVAVTGVARGSATITVAASDPSNSALQDFTASVRLGDREVLEILYDELGGDKWRNNRDWKTNKPLDEWYAVSTNADGRVDSLILWYNFLTGEIPPELGDLSNLEVLYLNDNQLTGEIPPELGDLSNLYELYLNDNQLTGEIPPELGDLSNLEILRLWRNSLTGKIPPELGGLSNLKILPLFGNQLTGEIPPELGDLSNLDVLSLWSNSLTGEIPPELGDLSRLYELYLNDNQLTGEIPPDFLNLSVLRWFYWDDNDGLCVPNTREFGDWLDGLVWRGPLCGR